MVFVPIYDINPLRRIRFQYATVAIIILNVLVFFIFQARDVLAGNECSELSFSKAFGLIPLELLGTPVGIEGCPSSAVAGIAAPEPLTLLTYMFLHGDIWHLVGNMLFLWVFGDNVEDALGHFRFVAFYLLCGIAGGLAHTLMQQTSTAPLIGASGATSGVVAAYLMLHPRVSMWVLVLRIIPLKVPAYLALGAWVIMNAVLAVIAVDQVIGWWAHLGGMVAGAVLVILLRQPGVKLFSWAPPTRSEPH